MQIGRSGASGRGHGEEGDSQGEQSRRAEAVAEGAAKQQQRGQRQEIGVDGPLQVGGAGAELPADRRQADVHHRAVHEGQA